MSIMGDGAADDFVATALEGGGVVGDYIVVAEVIFGDHVELQVGVSSGMSPWKANGMLQNTLDVVDYAKVNDPTFEGFRDPFDEEEDTIE